MTVSRYTSFEHGLWITSCLALVQICDANCEEGNCLQLHTGWGAWYIWVGIVAAVLICCGVAKNCYRKRASSGSVRRSLHDMRHAGLSTVHVTSSSGSMLGRAYPQATGSSTQVNFAASSTHATAPPVGAMKQHYEKQTTTNDFPPAYCDSPPPPYSAVTHLPTYEQSNDTSNPAVSRL